MKKYTFQMMVLVFLLIAVGASAQQNALDKLNLPASPKLVVAYGLRQLSSAATKALEVRRSSDNKVQDIGFDAQGNLNTKSLTDFVGTGDGFVSKWYDQSGKNIHAAQEAQEAQPKVVDAGNVLMENGRPIIHTSNDRYLVYSGMTAFSGSSTASRLSVCMLQRGHDNGIIEEGIIEEGIIDGLDSHKLDFKISACNVVEFQVDDKQKVEGVSIGSARQLMAVSAIRESRNSLLYINGKMRGGNTAQLNNFDSPISGYIGRRCDGNGWPAGYAELILYNSALSKHEVSDIAKNQFLYYNMMEQTNALSVYNFLGVSTAGAFSLRRVSNDYTGHAIQVRRSSNDEVMDIDFDMMGNLETTQLLDFAGSGDAYVSVWYDQSGLKRDKTQTVLSNQPQIVSKGSLIMKNDKPAIFFPAKSKAGLEGSPKNYLSSGDITVCFNAWSNSTSEVPRRAIQGNKQDWFVGPYNNGNAYWTGDWNLQDASNPWSQSGELFVVSQPALGQNKVYRNGLEITRYKNNTKGYPGSISISAAGFADEPFDGYMSELLEFNTALSKNDIMKVQNSVSSCSGIPISNNNIRALVTTDKQLLSIFSLRLINSDYEGPLVRLAVGALFYDVYPDDNNKLSADSPISAAMSDYNAAGSGDTNFLSSILTSSTNASVAIWYDQSGEAKHLKQPEESHRPILVKQGTIVTQAKKGNPALEFSSAQKTHLIGSNDCLNGYDDGYINVVYTNTSDAAVGTPNGQYLVSKPQSWHLVTNISTHNNGGYFSIYPNGTLDEKQRVISFFNPTIKENSKANILSVSFNKESAVVHGNQVDVGRSKGGTTIYANTNGLQIGGIGLAANNQNSFDGLIQELVITRGLSEVERRTLETMQSVYYKTNTSNTWAGGANEDWNDPCNWTLARVPISADEVCIPRGSSKWPTISESVQTPALIVVEPAAKVNLAGTFSGNLPKVNLLADEDSTGIVINKAGVPLGEVGIQMWFTAQKGFRIVSNPFKTTQSLTENSSKSGFLIAAKNEEASPEKSAAPAAPSIVISDAQYFTNNLWKNLVLGTTQEGIPYAIHYGGLDPASLSDKDYGPSPFPYYSKGEMYSGSTISVNAANSISQFTLAGNPFTAPIKTKALTQGTPYYIFDAVVGTKSVSRRTESGMWIPHLPSDNAITPVLGAVAFKQTTASPTISVPASAVDIDPPTKDAADYLQLDLEKDEEYRDRLFIKLADEYNSASSDKMDLEKLMNAEVNTYTMTPEKMKLSIDCRQKPTNAPIPVYVSYKNEGFYNFRVRHNGLADASEIYLLDKRFSKAVKMEEGMKYVFFISDNENQSENRFEICALGLTAIKEAKKDKGIIAYPIPAKEEILIHSDKDMESITLFDLNGRTVQTQEAFGTKAKMPLNNLQQGLYVLRIQSKEGVECIKIIKSE